MSYAVLLTTAEGKSLADKPTRDRTLYKGLRYDEALEKARLYRVTRYIDRRTGDIFEMREADTAGCAYSNPRLYETLNRVELLETLSYALPVDEADLVHYEPAEKPAEASPTVVEFAYVLHDDLHFMERCAEISRATGIPIVGELADKMMENPFYDVALRCQLDTTTGKITILDARTT